MARRRSSTATTRAPAASAPASTSSHVPAITLTDPNNLNCPPSPAQSPVKLAPPIRWQPETPQHHHHRVPHQAPYSLPTPLPPPSPPALAFSRSDATVAPSPLPPPTVIRAVRPETPSSLLSTSSKHPSLPARPDTASSWASPGRLIRTRSTGGQSNNGGGLRDDVGNDAHDAQSSIDPLSQHIFRRTGNHLSAAASPSPRPRSPRPQSPANGISRPSSAQGPAPAVQEPMGPPLTTVASSGRPDGTESNAARDLRKGVKAVAFLSRLMGAKKRDDEDDDESSVVDDTRPEGNDAEVFARPPLDNMGFRPQHPPPPAYIKVRSRYKKQRDFDRVFLAQELFQRDRPLLQQAESSTNRLRRKSSHATNADPTLPRNTVWAMEFSKDGRYLAVGGADRVVRVWAVLASREDRQKHEMQESNDANGHYDDGAQQSQQQHLSAPVFQSRPVCEFVGHTGAVLDLSWSKNNFLLSSSMDKTVRLWHVSRQGCICTFQHQDFVPSVAFHPKDDRFFLAGSLDAKLRLWSIPDKNVAFSVLLPEMITAVAFTPDGKYAMAGCLSGLCMFFETEGLRYQSQIHVRSTRGQNARGSKITGIRAQHGASGDTKVLITSNDSRIRVYNFRDKSLELKFKGNENAYSQIRAGASDDGRYVICGSEDRKAYIWSLDHAYLGGEKRDKTPLEYFEAHDTVTTAVCFAPTKTRLHLGRSEDPVYDVCNPPPVELLSQAERADRESLVSSRPPTASGPGSSRTSLRRQRTNDENDATAAELLGNGSVPGSSGSSYKNPRYTSSSLASDKPFTTPAYIARSAHQQGNIIVTADLAGRIKVFRQDCAWAKRNVRGGPDDWDRGSLFSKRSITGGGSGDNSRGTGGKLSRTGSLATRASQRSLRDSRTSSSTTYAPSERYVPAPSSSSAASWRQGSSTRSSRNNLIRRAHSPGFDPVSKSADNLSNTGHPTPPSTSKSDNSGFPHINGHALDHAHPLVANVMTQSPPPLDDEVSSPSVSSSHPSAHTSTDDELSTTRQRHDHDFSNSHALDSGGSYVFWDASRINAHAAHLQTLHKNAAHDHATHAPPPPILELSHSPDPAASPTPSPLHDHSAPLQPSPLRPPLASAQISYLSNLSAEHASSDSDRSDTSPHPHDRAAFSDDDDDDDDDDYFDDAREFHASHSTDQADHHGDAVQNTGHASQNFANGMPLRCPFCHHTEHFTRHERVRARDYGMNNDHASGEVYYECGKCGRRI